MDSADTCLPRTTLFSPPIQCDTGYVADCPDKHFVFVCWHNHKHQKYKSVELGNQLLKKSCIKNIWISLQQRSENLKQFCWGVRPNLGFYTHKTISVVQIISSPKFHLISFLFLAPVPLNEVHKYVDAPNCMSCWMFFIVQGNPWTKHNLPHSIHLLPSIVDTYLSLIFISFIWRVFWAAPRFVLKKEVNLKTKITGNKFHKGIPENI